MGHELRREGSGRGDDVVEPGDQIGAPAEVDEPFAGDHLHHRHQEVGVGAGADRHPLRRRLGGARPTGVHHHDRAAPLHQRARSDRASPGAVAREPLEAKGFAPSMSRWSVRSTSGTGTFSPPPNMSARGDLLGPLVDRRGGEHVGAPQRPEQGPVVEQAGEVVGVRVADVDRAGVPAVLVEEREEPPLDLREGLVPAHLHEGAVSLDDGAAQPVRILVELLERGALGADVALAEDVVTVAPDPHDLLAGRRGPQGDLEPAARLAQRARAVGGAGGGVGGRGRRWAPARRSSSVVPLDARPSGASGPHPASRHPSVAPVSSPMSMVTAHRRRPADGDPQRGPQAAGAAERRAQRAQARQRHEGDDHRDDRSSPGGGEVRHQREGRPRGRTPPRRSRPPAPAAPSRPP